MNYAMAVCVTDVRRLLKVIESLGCRRVLYDRQRMRPSAPPTHQIANDLEVCDLPALANEYTAPRVPTKPDRNSYPTYK